MASGWARTPDLHTADAAECAAVKTDPGWLFEGVVFQVVAPTRARARSRGCRLPELQRPLP